MTTSAACYAYFPDTEQHRKPRGHREPVMLYDYKVHPAAPKEILRYAVSRRGAVVHRCETWKAAKDWALDRLHERYLRLAATATPCSAVAEIGQVLQEHGRFR